MVLPENLNPMLSVLLPEASGKTSDPSRTSPRPSSGSPPRPDPAWDRGRCAARPCGRRGRPRRALAGFAEVRFAIQGHGAFTLELAQVHHLAEEIELDGDVVRVLEEDLKQLRVGKAAHLHLDLVLLDPVAHALGILGEKRDVVDRARAAGALRMLLQQKLVADPVRVLRG